MRLSLVPATLAACAAIFVATPAAAEYDVAYLGLRGSYVFTDGGSTQGGTFDYDEEYADGFAVAAYFGWVLDDSFRLEAEGGFRSADIDEVTIVRDGGAPYSVGDVVDVGGDVQVGTAMVNLYYDLHLFDGPILPWIGAGIGGAFVDVAIDDPLFALNGKDTTWVFAYQFKAGITFPVSDGISMSLGYTYFQTQDFAYVNDLLEENETDLTQHSADVSLQFHL
jgi:opacity protein-like surface antigen